MLGLFAADGSWSEDESWTHFAWQKSHRLAMASRLGWGTQIFHCVLLPALHNNIWMAPSQRWGSPCKLLCNNLAASLFVSSSEQPHFGHKSHFLLNPPSIFMCAVLWCFPLETLSISKLLSLWLFRQALSDEVVLDLETMFDQQQNPIFCYFSCCFCF